MSFPGRWWPNRAAGRTAGAIIAEVLRRLAVTDEAGRELVRESCEDAAGGATAAVVSDHRGEGMRESFPDAPAGVGAVGLLPGIPSIGRTPRCGHHRQRLGCRQ
jgi:hypothetical protein